MDKTNLKNRQVICLCNSNRVWGGGERWHLETALWLAERGHEVILAAAEGMPLYKAAQRELAADPALGQRLRLAAWGFRNLDVLNPVKIRSFRSFLLDNQVDCLLAGLPVDMKVAVLASRDLADLKVFYRRGSAIRVRGSITNRFFYRRLAGVIVNSQATANGVLESGKLAAASKVHIIPNGLDIAAFDAALQSKKRARGEHPLIIGNAGRLNTQKGQKYLLHMSAELKRRGVAHFLIIAGSGELADELKRLALSLDLRVGKELRDGADVCFTGFVKDMSEFWQDIDLFVLSSLWEGFGYVLAEAMLAEKPVLAFNCNSMPELVRAGENGELVAAPSIGESDAAVGKRLAEAVQKMAANGEKLKHLGLYGREFCIGNYNQEKLMVRLEEVLGISAKALGAF